MTPQEEQVQFDTITAQNLHLLKKMEEPDFDGSTQLDPTFNKAQRHIHAADEVIASYPQGNLPRGLAWDSVKTTLQLLKRSRDKYGPDKTKEIEQCFRRHFMLWFYHGGARNPPEVFKKKLFASEERLINALCSYVCTLLKDEMQEQKKSGRPAKSIATRRGPKDTRMMKAQRTALVVYVTVELHKAIVDVTLSDAHHVWHLPENLKAWNEAAGRKDIRRGYKDYISLYAAVKASAEKNAKKLMNLTAV